MPLSSSLPIIPSFSISSRIKDYFALTKPGISMVVLMTTASGFLVAAKESVFQSINPSIFFHTLLGTALTAVGAGSLNMLLEQDSDALMERTKRRPLPSGRVYPEEAFIIGILSGSLGVVHLARMTNLLTSFLAALSLVLYLVFYTPLKKSSPFCTVVGAVSGALPPLIGWSAFKGTLTLEACSLFLILFVWQFPHLLSLAWLYKEDFKKANFKNWAQQDENGVWTARTASVLSIVLLISSLIPYQLKMAGAFYLFSSLILGLLLFSSTLIFLDRRNVPSARSLFLTTVFYIPLLLLAMVLKF